MSSSRLPLHPATSAPPRKRRKRRQAGGQTAKAQNVELAVLCHALSNPVRVQILRELMRKGCICGEIVVLVGLAQSTVSEHLRILRESGLVTGEIDGPRTCYCANPAAIRRLEELVSLFPS